MTNDEIRIAIAESQGWTRYRHPAYENDIDKPWVPTGFDYDKSPYSLIKETMELPNYAEDLNAMHEVEKTLSDSDYANYIHILNEVCISTAEQGMKKGRSRIMSATARQRAEAYLRTKGLWKE